MDKKEKTLVFSEKIKEKIYNGDFDDEISIPFMSRKLIKSSIDSRINKKLETGGTPLLSDSEIDAAVIDAKETAVSTTQIFIELGIITKTEEGYEVPEKVKKALMSLLVN